MDKLIASATIYCHVVHHQERNQKKMIRYSIDGQKKKKKKMKKKKKKSLSDSQERIPTMTTGQEASVDFPDF